VHHGATSTITRIKLPLPQALTTSDVQTIGLLGATFSHPSVLWWVVDKTLSCSSASSRSYFSPYLSFRSKVLPSSEHTIDNPLSVFSAPIPQSIAKCRTLRQSQSSSRLTKVSGDRGRLWISCGTDTCHFAELVSTLENSSLFQKKPEYKKALMVASIPERVIQFRVCERSI
jgi:hypothetical protein